MLQYIGSICIFIFTFYFVFSYEKYQKRKILQGKVFLDFLKNVENEMRGLGRPMAICASEFLCLDKGAEPFFSALSEGVSAAEAYRKVRASLSLPVGMDALLCETFAAFSGGRDAVRRCVVDAREQCERLMDTARTETDSRLRLFRTLTTASAMGLVILLL